MKFWDKFTCDLQSIWYLPPQNVNQICQGFFFSVVNQYVQLGSYD